MDRILIQTRLGTRTPVQLDIRGAVPAAVALILAPLKGGGFETLLIKRAVDACDPWSGQISLPGGRCERRDRDPVATAIRETQEETGVNLSRTQLLGRLNDTQPKGRGLPKVVFRTYVFSIPKRQTLLASSEVDQAFWLPLEKIDAGREQAEVAASGKTMIVDAFHVEPYVIWGATHRVLDELLRLIG